MTMTMESPDYGDFAQWVPPTSLVCSLALTSMKVMCPMSDPVEDFLRLPLSHPTAQKGEDLKADTKPIIVQEENLVDIDPLEGRRRGEQLMSMLNLKPSEVVESNQRSRLTAAAAPFQPSACMPCQPTTEQSSRVVSGFGGPGIPLYLPIISEAARRLFQGDLEGVEGDVRDGFVVRVGGEWGKKDVKAVLDSLSIALWPLLGGDVVGVEPHVIPRRAWLTLHCMQAHDLQSICWDFYKTGQCRRAGQCRWRHIMPETYAIDVEISCF